MEKCIVLFSGGLDSRLALKIMQEQKLETIALFFQLPFGCGMQKEEIKKFCKKHKTKLKIINCSNQKHLKDYTLTLKKPKYGTGAGANPCIDCKMFMLKKAKEFADENKIDLIVTGEVLGERPMSQMKKALNIIEKETKLKGRLLRPLSAKLFPPTKAETEKIVDREKLYKIHGRRREPQMKLAKKFKINYPQPAGGCILCEKTLKKRFQKLFKRNLNKKEIELVSIGRHFIIDKKWVILGRNEKENKIIEKTGEKDSLIIPDFIGPSAIILDKYEEKTKNKVKKLIEAYSKKGNLKERKKFEKYKL